MKLVELLQLAHESYADGLEDYFDPQTGAETPADRHQDTLALFIVRELKDTFDPDATEHQQSREAHRAMRLAADQLRRIADGF